MTFIFYLVDYIAITLSLHLSLYIRNKLPFATGVFNIPHLYTDILIPAIFLLVLIGLNTHKQYVPSWRLSRDIFKATSFSTIIIVLLLFLGNIISITSRLYVVIEWILSFLSIIVCRILLRTILHKLKIYNRRILVVGAGKTAELLVNSIKTNGFGMKIVGFLDDNPKSSQIPPNYPILGGFTDLEKIVKQNNIDSIIIATPGLEEKKLKTLANRAMLLTKRLSIIPNLVGLPLGNVQIENFIDFQLPVLRIENNLSNPFNRRAKRTFDIIVTIIGSTLIAPLLLFIALLIKITSPGPIVFAHYRVGKNGKHFLCYKFRTMVTNSEDILEKHLASNLEARKEWKKRFKLKKDPRITKIGHFLRKTSLDELPQLWNVIKGDMSLVGPRPIVDDEIDKYGLYIKDFFLVRPGITGLWQISGRSDTSYEERIQMDSWYVRNWSIWLDLIYLLRTIKVVLSCKGSY